MKYLCLAYYDARKFESLSESEVQALVSQCPAYDRALRESGGLVLQASLGSGNESSALRPRMGKVSVTDGPYAETKEQIGGFFIIEAQSREEAIAIAANHPAAHLGEHVGWGIELRPIEGYTETPR